MKAKSVWVRNRRKITQKLRRAEFSRYPFYVSQLFNNNVFSKKIILFKERIAGVEYIRIFFLKNSETNRRDPNQ